MTQVSPTANLKTANSIETADKTIYDMTSSKEFSKLHSAIKASGLKETLNDAGPYTLFAPTDEAFDKLAPGTLDTLMKSENKDRLVAVIKNHIVSGRFVNSDVNSSKDAQTLSGNSARLSSYLDVNTQTADTACSNGVIHSIDRVVLPN